MQVAVKHTLPDGKISWRDVFCADHAHWGHIDYALDRAAIANYCYMCWQGKVYIGLQRILHRLN